jgi:thiol-disulfide isomerase/thioredoxin
MVRVLVFLAFSVRLFAQCEPALAVRETLEQAWAAGLELPHKDAQPARQKIYRLALEKHPHDYFLLRMILDTTADKAAALEWAKAQRDTHPEHPVYELIYAHALEGRDTPEAQRLFERIGSGHPQLTRAYLALANLSRWGGKFDDADRADRELAKFLKACPAPLDAAPLRTIARAAAQDRAAAAVAAAVRERLLDMPHHLMADVHETLWRLEFNATPPPGHAALRTRLEEDLRRLEDSPARNTLRWLELLRHGYQNSGNQERADAILDEILAKFPKSELAKQELRNRWQAEHPYPVGTDMQKVASWARAAAAKYAEWHRLWPDDSHLYFRWFSAVLDIPDSPAEQVGRMGDKLVELYHANPNWWITQAPVEYIVADAFLKNQVNVDKVPTLVAQGSDSAENRDRERLADDRLPDDLRSGALQGIENRKIERARILLTYYAATKNPEPAKLIEAELMAMEREDPQGKANLLKQRGLAAELLGRKLDALIFYRAALAIEPQSTKPTDPLRQNIQRLWEELQGTPAAYGFFLDKPKPAEATAYGWEKPERPMPDFTLQDLNGRTWTLETLAGKVVLINVWATWCGPCRQEHPAFQKLYDELKTHSDVTVISFNVDENIGSVAPYLQRNRYTFPVLPARVVVDQVLDSVSIPQNWFLNRDGVLEAVQVGYRDEAEWRRQITAKLGEILGGR